MTDNTDLIKAYEFVAGQATFLPSDLADKFGHNMRYSREIIGVLMGKGLATLNTSTDLDYYEAVLPDDPADIRKFGMKKMGLKEDEVRQPKAPKAPRASKPTDTKDYHPCLCGCGENVPPKSNYRPGHDARHAGVIARAVAESGDTGLYADLGSDRLREKAVAMASRIVAKAGKSEIKAGKPVTTKPSEVRPPEFLEGTVKVGKNEFAAKKYSASNEVSYLAANGEWKAASKAAAKTFTV